MQNCPPEICHKIFALATAADDGSTGCALSLVSRYIYNTSQPARLQSVAIRGLDNLLAFGGLLEKLSPEHRRIRHIFVSTHDRLFDEVANEVAHSLAETNHSMQDIMHVQQTAVQSEEPLAQRESAMFKALWKVLDIAAPTIEILHLAFVKHLRSSVLVPLTLPVMRELTLHGPTVASWQDFPTSQPSLRRLHLTGTPCQPWGTFVRVGMAAPGLTHFRISGLRESGIESDLMAGLRKIIPIQPTIERILFQLGPPFELADPIRAMEYSRLKEGLELGARQDNRVGLIKAQAERQYSITEIQKMEEMQWLERIGGGDGCWDETDLVEVEPLRLLGM